MREKHDPDCRKRLPNRSADFFTRYHAVHMPLLEQDLRNCTRNAIGCHTPAPRSCSRIVHNSQWLKRLTDPRFRGLSLQHTADSDACAGKSLAALGLRRVPHSTDANEIIQGRKRDGAESVDPDAEAVDAELGYARVPFEWVLMLSSIQWLSLRLRKIQVPRQLLTSSEIGAFFDPTRRDAQEILPLFVRRLIVASTQPGTLSALNIPGGDDIRLPGWDGRLSLTGNHPYIPTGRCVWEMGVSREPASKATSDFRKRSAKPGQGIDPAKSTFVFVTPHIWPGKQAWVTTQKKTSVWRDIRVIDGQVLAEWSDLAPAVAAWFHQIKGTSVLDVEDTETSWARLIQEPLDREVPPALVIAGRNEAAEALTQWLLNPDGDRDIGGESAEEVVAFVAAVVKAAPAREVPLDLSPRVMVARSKSALLYVGAVQSPQIVVLEDPHLAAEFKVTRSRLVSMIVPVVRTNGTGKTVGAVSIDLAPLRREEAEKVLQSLDYRRDVARRIAIESRGSLQALLWGMSARSMRGLPWLNNPAAIQLAPLVLARRWSMSEHQDQKAVSRLADREYRDITLTTAEWSKPGGPLQVWGPLWDWKAWRAAWEHLAPSFQPDLVNRFMAVCRDVLGTRDPALDLAPDDRHLANIHGKTHPYSKAFRDGLVSSIAMFGAMSDRLTNFDGQRVATVLVRELLNVSKSVDSWLTLDSWLPELAEAAPDVFLDAAERLAADTSASAAMFQEGGMFGPTSPHVHLLWALERLAWNPALLSRVVIALGKFAERDPGGNMGNRPSASLRQILLSWSPGTAADVQQRLAALDQLIKRSPEVAWKLSVALLPKFHDTGSPTVVPQYRDWGDHDRKRTTFRDYHAFTAGLVDRAIAMAGQSPDRWTLLTASLPDVLRESPKAGRVMARALLALDPKSWNREARVALGETLRDLVLKHEEFPNSDWAIQGRALQALRRAAKKFAPESTRDQRRWLFTPFPQLPGWGHDFDAHDKQVEVERTEAIAQVRDEEGLSGVLAWAAEVEAQENFGATLAKLPLTDIEEGTILEETILAAAASDDQSVARRVGHGFVRSREEERGVEWGHGRLNQLERQHDSAVVARFALALRSTIEQWKWLESHFPKITTMYWERARSFPLSLEEGEYMVPRLIKVRRSFSALSAAGALVHHAKKDDDKQVIERTLALCMLATQELADHNPTKEHGAGDWGAIRHRISEVLDFIEKHSGDTPETQQLLVQWEWRWLPVFEHSGRGLRALWREVARSPEFFVEVLKVTYRAKGEDFESTTNTETAEEAEARSARAEQGWKLLRGWRTVPGLTTTSAIPQRGNTIEIQGSPTLPAVVGNIDTKVLNAWVSDARRLARECDRIDTCDSHIGGVFAYSPADSDGKWPAAPVREIIEDLASDAMESGFSTEMFNRRGVHSVGRTGSAEREIRDTYLGMAAKIDQASPRTAAILRSVGESYDAQAKRRDDEGKRREFYDE